MRTILRSLFVSESTDHASLALRNYFRLLESGLGFDQLEEVIIFKYIRNFVGAYNHVPTAETLKAHFINIQEDEVASHISSLETFQSKYEGDFENHLSIKVNDLRFRQVSELLKEAGVIATTGLEIKIDGQKEKKIVRGPVEAVRHVIDRSHDIVAPVFGGRLSGEVTTDGDDFRKEYERIEQDPQAGVGHGCGLTQMDRGTGGAKRQELWVHAAFTGGLKSTLMINWAYTQAVGRWSKDNKIISPRNSSLIFSLEMPYQQVRRMLYSIHSIHDKFKAIRYELGLQEHPDDEVGLPYLHIRDGTLPDWHPNAKKFLFDHVIPDLNDPSNRYGKIHIEVADPDKSDFTVADLRAKAELIYSKSPFRLLFCDHVGLMAPRKWVSSTTERLNEIIRDLKRLSMSFNRGQGMAVIALFQINREGYKRCLKAKEAGRTPVYNLTDLSYANEAERSADIVSACWMDKDLIGENRAQMQCLKSRDGAMFEMFKARVEWPCRRLFACYDVVTVEDKKRTEAAVDEATGAALD